MIKIRPNTFETNSSSSHSIVLTVQDNGRYTPEEAFNELYWITEDGYWQPSDHELYFGRAPFKVLTTFKDKLLYAYANAPVRRRMDKLGRVYYYRNYTKITNTVKKLLPELKGVKWYGDDRPDCDDHPLFGWLRAWNMSLEEYLMNKNVIIICDGDEYCIWSNIKHSGLTNGCIAKELPVMQWFEED